jgi:Tfp pilus assembly protein PilF
MPLNIIAAQDTRRAAIEQYQAGSKAFVEQNFDAAITALTRSLALQPRQLRVMRLLGLSYQLAGRMEEAEATFNDSVRLAPGDAESLFFLGRVYYIRNFFDKALPALQKAVSIAPLDARIRECLALTLEASGDPQAAEKEYQQAQRDAGPQNATVDMNYGALLLKMNRPTESQRLLTKAATALPKFWQARFELARLYYQTERFDASLAELTAALECPAKPDETSRTHALMALVYGRLGRHEDAKRAAAAAER